MKSMIFIALFKQVLMTSFFNSGESYKIIATKFKDIDKGIEEITIILAKKLRHKQRNLSQYPLIEKMDFMKP